MFRGVHRVYRYHWIWPTFAYQIEVGCVHSPSHITAFVFPCPFWEFRIILFYAALCCDGRMIDRVLISYLYRWSLEIFFSNFILYCACDYLSVLGLTLNHVSNKNGPDNCANFIFINFFFIKLKWSTIFWHVTAFGLCSVWNLPKSGTKLWITNFKQTVFAPKCLWDLKCISTFYEQLPHGLRRQIPVKGLIMQGQLVHAGNWFTAKMFST